MKWLLVAVGLLAGLTVFSVDVANAAHLTVNPPTLEAFRYNVHIAIPAVQANVDVKPDTLQMKSGGQTVTAFIQLPAPYNVADIVLSSVSLGYDVNGDGVIGPGEYVLASGGGQIGDHNGDGIPDLKVTFDRAQVVGLLQNLMTLGDVTLTVRGQVGNATFTGTDVVKVTL